MKPIVFLFFIAFLFSCGKKREIKIIAKNAATGQPYSGLEYSIVSSKTGWDGEKYRTEASGTLNANGEVLVAIKQRSGRTYSVAVQGPENNCYTNMLVQTFDSPFDNDGTFTFEFAECAFLRQNIVNINCEGPNDVFNVRDRFTYSDWTGWSFDIMGCFSNIGGDYFQVPAGKRYFQWTVSRSSGVTSGIDSIDLSPGEYGEININY
ncbi:MAG: hypothetical protein IT221_08305 [Fluviicola sp.]|nr:hypothetical protein [Fluviicola sp.]